MAKLIKSNGTITDVEQKNGKDFSLGGLQGFVGGYIEVVHVLTGAPKNTIMVVNEEGKIRNLPINELATAMIGFTDTIVGDVLVCDSSQMR